MTDVTRLFEAAHRGDRQAAAVVLRLAYVERRKLCSSVKLMTRPEY